MFFRDQIKSMSQVVMENELFFISCLHKCKVRAIDDVHLVVHACNIVAPYFHDKVIKYLQNIVLEKVKPVEVLPVYPLMRSFLDLLVDYEARYGNPELHGPRNMNFFHYSRPATQNMK